LNKTNNKLLVLISTIILLASTILILMPPTANAQQGVTIGTPQVPTTGGPIPSGITPSISIETIPYISFAPNPIGVGQELLINVWLQPATQVNRAHTGYTVTITEPDGHEIVVGPFVSYQADATAWLTYTPEVAGTYQIQFSFAGDYYPAGYYYMGLLANTSQSSTIYVSGGNMANQGFNATQDCYYKPSTSEKYTLVVQDQMVPSWQSAPLPTDYWTRPITPNNREWWVIGGNCPNNEMGGGTGSEGWPDNTNIYRSNYKFTPYVMAPNSGHIVWKMQGPGFSGAFGGLINGAYTKYQQADQDFNGASFSFGTAGPGNAGNPNIVWQSRCYQSINKVFNGVNQAVWTCYDLRTGEIYWEKTGVTQVPQYISYSQNAPPVSGAGARTDRTVASLLYIGNNLVTKYNPMTGAVTLNQTIPTMSNVNFYSDPFVLSIQNIGNTSRPNYRLLNWTLEGLGSNFTTSLMGNVSYPFSTLGTADFESMIAATYSSTNSPATGVASNVRIIAASLTTGQLLWNISADTGYPIFSGSTAVADHGKYAIRFDDGRYYAWNLQNGQKVWQSEISSEPWGTFGCYAVQSAYGMLFANQYDGVVALDWNDGKIVWWFQAPAPAFETPYTNGTGNTGGSVYSFFSDSIVADGKIYTYTVEHSPTAPLTRGWKTFCINATTGEGIWQANAPMTPGVVADGYITATSYYDAYLYVFGKGQSLTTVTAPQTQIAPETTAVISGTVLDQSPGQAGTPCVSKESMADWMAYLHLQGQHPTNVVGVPVSIDAVDPNNNFVHLGDAVSDETGTFAFVWTPTIAGQYKISATFMGDDSYGSSYANTYVNVAEASAATPTASSNTGTNDVVGQLSIYIIGVAIAIIIAVAIVGVLILRKHP
jgi:outer membrane protein assembly factor BamB